MQVQVNFKSQDTRSACFVIFIFVYFSGMSTAASKEISLCSFYIPCQNLLLNQLEWNKWISSCWTDYQYPVIMKYDSFSPYAVETIFISNQTKEKYSMCWYVLIWRLYDNRWAMYYSLLLFVIFSTNYFTIHKNMLCSQ